MSRADGQGWVYDLFIAYASPDRERADLVWEEARRQQISTFLDHQSVPEHSLWPTTIPEALRQSRVLLFLCSGHSFTAIYQLDEAARALGREQREREGRRLVVVPLESGLEAPYGLAPYQSRPWESAEEVVGRVRRALEEPAQGLSVEVRAELDGQRRGVARGVLVGPRRVLGAEPGDEGPRWLRLEGGAEVAVRERRPAGDWAPGLWLYSTEEELLGAQGLTLWRDRRQLWARERPAGKLRWAEGEAVPWTEGQAVEGWRPEWAGHGLWWQGRLAGLLDAQGRPLPLWHLEDHPELARWCADPWTDPEWLAELQRLRARLQRLLQVARVRLAVQRGLEPPASRPELEEELLHRPARQVIEALRRAWDQLSPDKIDQDAVWAMVVALLPYAADWQREVAELRASPGRSVELRWNLESAAEMVLAGVDGRPMELKLEGAELRSQWFVRWPAAMEGVSHSGANAAEALAQVLAQRFTDRALRAALADLGRRQGLVALPRVQKVLELLEGRLQALQAPADRGERRRYSLLILDLEMEEEQAQKSWELVQVQLGGELPSLRLVRLRGELNATPESAAEGLLLSMMGAERV